jgi:hypothetical protein
MPPTIYETLNPEPLNPWTVTVLLAGYTPSEGLVVTLQPNRKEYIFIGGLKNDYLPRSLSVFSLMAFPVKVRQNYSP